MDLEVSSQPAFIRCAVCVGCGEHWPIEEARWVDDQKETP